METIPKNSPWHDKREVKKGEYGEELVRRILERNGFKVYQAVTDGSHLIDFIVERDKNLIFAVEVKTKSMMKKYAETGINYDHYKEYRDFSIKARMPVLLAFVDSSKKAIYGNFLSVLDEPRIQAGIQYPKTMPAKFYQQGKMIRYYPEMAMLPIGILSDRDVAFLSQHSATHY